MDIVRVCNEDVQCNRKVEVFSNLIWFLYDFDYLRAIYCMKFIIDFISYIYVHSKKQ